jgi:hypothetical protein
MTAQQNQATFHFVWIFHARRFAWNASHHCEDSLSKSTTVDQSLIVSSDLSHHITSFLTLSIRTTVFQNWNHTGRRCLRAIRRHFGKLQRLISQRPDIHHWHCPRSDFIQRSIEERELMWHHQSPVLSKYWIGNSIYDDNVQRKTENLWSPQCWSLTNPTYCPNLDPIFKCNHKITYPVENHQKCSARAKKREFSCGEY